MWISRKEYRFLKENAEKNINAECEILRVKDKQYKDKNFAVLDIGFDDNGRIVVGELGGIVNQVI